MITLAAQLQRTLALLENFRPARISTNQVSICLGKQEVKPKNFQKKKTNIDYKKSKEKCDPKTLFIRHKLQTEGERTHRLHFL